MSKLIKIDKKNPALIFDDGVKLYSDHHQDCCEHHEITLDDLELSDFEGLEFDFTNDNFFKRIEGFGIELIPVQGHSVKIPAHGYNNGYYGTDLELVIEGDGILKKYDISECQVIED